MGEMIKFGIKLALTVACAVALVAAISLLFSLISSVSFNSVQALTDIFYLISLVIPINVKLVFVTITSLFSFKVAYWAADKMIQFIGALG